MIFLRIVMYFESLQHEFMYNLQTSHWNLLLPCIQAVGRTSQNRGAVAAVFPGRRLAGGEGIVGEKVEETEVDLWVLAVGLGWTEAGYPRAPMADGGAARRRRCSDGVGQAGEHQWECGKIAGGSSWAEGGRRGDLHGEVELRRRQWWAATLLGLAGGDGSRRRDLEASLGGEEGVCGLDLG